MNAIEKLVAGLLAVIALLILSTVVLLFKVYGG
jgi:hypothetical protein